MSQELQPCPFCGMPPDRDNPDTLHPNGTGWRTQSTGMRTYHHYREVPADQHCYTMHCPTTAGGCGAEISGDSEAETVTAWNRRAAIAAPPVGWVMVPVEPTQAMCQEGQWKAQEWPKFPLRIVPIWKAMLAAAPSAPDAPKE